MLALRSLFNALKKGVCDFCWEWELFLIVVAKNKGVENYHTRNLSESTLTGFIALSFRFCTNSDSRLTKLLTQNTKICLYLPSAQN